MERIGFTVAIDPGQYDSVRVTTVDGAIKTIKTFVEECFEEARVDGAAVIIPTREQLESLRYGVVFMCYDNYFNQADAPFFRHVVAYVTGVYLTRN